MSTFCTSSDGSLSIEWDFLRRRALRAPRAHARPGGRWMIAQDEAMQPQVRVLDENQITAIHRASLDVLGRTGYDVPLAEARELLAAAGARIDGQRAWIPSRLVEQALESMRVAELYDRNGRATPVLQREHVAFGGLVDTSYVRDYRTGKVRRFFMRDQEWMATVHDALPNIEWIQVVGQSHDVPDEIQTQVAYAHTVRHTTKPILVYPYDRQGLLDVLDVAAAIAGGEGAYRDKPFMFCASVPAAPLSGTGFNLELLLTCAEREVPMLYYACPAAGGNSPASLVGSLILATADWLGALVIHQLRRPGAPVCTFGFTAQLMEMRTMIWSYSAPEMQRACGAIADMAHFYGLPAWGTVLESDYPVLDGQAGAEMSTAALWAMFSGVEMVHNIGRSGAGKLVSAEAAVLADEIIACARAAVQPMEVSDCVLDENVRLIDEMGPMGEYLTHEHTLRHFRDYWYPALFDRPHFDPQGGDVGPELCDRLSARAKVLIEDHTSPTLSAGTLAEMEAMERNWYKRAGQRRMAA
ncbi:trimethylamine methyltransferase family protein [Chloroflexota bacterium]